MNGFSLSGTRIFDGEAMLSHHALIIERGKIRAIVPDADIPMDLPNRRLNGGLLAPGFVDLQVNGGGGECVNNNPTSQALAHIAKAHAKFGTTALLPTVITDAPAILDRAILATREAMRLGTPGILGLHCEGPFLDASRCGAHPKEFIRKATAPDINALMQADCGVLMVTLSPSQVNAADITRLSNAGVIVSLGHSDADAELAELALQAGARAFTHLFNAMSPLTHRAPGMVGAALASPTAYCGLICDGLHVDPKVLTIALRAKNTDLMVLVSDAMPPAAGGPDRFTLQGRTITRHDGRLQLDDGTLAGCDLTMDAALRYCVHVLGVGLGPALQMASRNPARLIGQSNQRGHLLPGFDADIVYLSEGLDVKGTWIAGNPVVFDRKS